MTTKIESFEYKLNRVWLTFLKHQQSLLKECIIEMGDKAQEYLDNKIEEIMSQELPRKIAMPRKETKINKIVKIIKDNPGLTRKEYLEKISKECEINLENAPVSYYKALKIIKSEVE